MLKTFLKTHLKLVILLIIAIFVVGAYPLASRAILIFQKTFNSNQNLENGLIAHWTFDGPNVDVSSSTAEIINTKSTTRGDWISHATTTVPGKIGQGIDFDGTDDYINVANPGIGASVYTVAFWTKPDSVSAGNMIWNGRGGSCVAHPAIYWSSGNIVAIHGSCGGLTASSPSSYSANDWRHITVTLSATTLSLYVDGVLATSTTGTPNSFSPACLFVGAVQNGDCATPQTLFNGIIDDVRIYNRVLSATDVKRLYDIGATTKINTSMDDANTTLKNGLIGHWTFDGKDTDLSSTTGEFIDRGSGSNRGDWRSHASSTGLGKIGQGYQTSGGGDVVFIGKPSIYNSLTTGTIAFWMKVDAASTSNQVMFAKDNTGSNVGDVALTIMPSNDAQYPNQLQVLGDATGGTGTQWYSDTALAFGEFNHIAYTFTTGLQRMYINGVLQSNFGSSSQLMSNSSADLIFGSRRIGVDPFKGILDDIRIYNRVLSATEIKRLYDIGATTKINTSMSGANNALENGLVAHYTFDGSDVLTGSTTGEIVNKKSSVRADWVSHASTTVPGKMGQAIDFDGTDDYILERNPSYEGSPIMTIAAWVRTTTIGVNTIFGVSDDGSNNEAFTFGVDGSGKLYARVKTTVDIKNCNSNTAGADGQVISGDWTFIVVTNNQTTGTDFYKNAVLQSDDCAADIDWIDDLSSAVDVATVGGWAVGSPAQFFDGMIDDVRIYNRALSATEIKRLYDMGR